MIMSRIRKSSLFTTFHTLISETAAPGAPAKMVQPKPTSPSVHNHNQADGYKRSTAPTALPLHKIVTAKLFPLDATTSFKDYMKRKELDRAQDALLRLLPFYTGSSTYADTNAAVNADTQDSTDPRTSEVLKVEVSKGRYMNEFTIYPKNADPSKLNHFVLIHGYGAGLGFYLKNFDEISKNPNWCIHALDLLGYGCSSRPKFDKAESIETYFLDTLETWRQKRGIDKMLMCSHSLGAYVSALYTMKYPGHVQKLLCISPAGIYRDPKPPGEIPVWFDWLWEKSVSPFALVRNAGPFGSLVTSGWTSRRFAKLTQKEQNLLHDYTYRIFNAPGAGEYYMPQILAAGGVPKTPLVDKIEQITCDTVWAYGDEDWMPRQGGIDCTKKITEHTPYKSDVIEFSSSGHHIYLDNYSEFNKYLVDEMKNYEKVYA